MTDDTHLNLPERQLANELAYLVADKMWRDLGRDVTDGEVYNIGQSNYEAGCHALNLVGVYQQGKHYTLHKVVVPVGGVHQHMADLEFVSRDAFNELLSAFIENYVSYDGTLSGGRRGFLVHQISASKSGQSSQSTDYQWFCPKTSRWIYVDRRNWSNNEAMVHLG